jgi:hypothetical protein
MSINYNCKHNISDAWDVGLKINEIEAAHWIEVLAGKLGWRGNPFKIEVVDLTDPGQINPSRERETKSMGLVRKIEQARA